MRPRLSDIAAQAGVSEATVSRVLNDKPGVAEPKRAAVLTALDVLGYERPAQLEQRQTRLVGLVVPELENPIFPAFAQVIGTALAQRGYTAVLCTQTPGGVSEDEYVDLLLERGVAGIIFVSGMHADTHADPGRYHRLRERRLPIVLVNGYAAGVDAPFVSNDDFASMELAVRHLAALGHTRIGLAVGPERYVPVIRKVKGFQHAMRTVVGVKDVRDLVAWSYFSVEGGQSAAAALLDRGCTALVCASDLMALGAIRAVRGLGRDVPSDVSVVGYDDSTLIAFTDPPLTTVRQSVGAMGNAAVRALLEEIAGHPVPRTELFFRPELVVRASTGPVPRASKVARRSGAKTPA